jgi:hypothetical protein
VSDFGSEWARCHDWLAAALNRAGGTHTMDDVLASVACGDMQFWPGARSAIVTEIVQYPRKRACNFFLVGGDLAELLDMKPDIEAWAASVGCDLMQCGGRKGWERVLTDYRAKFVVLTKELVP